MRKKKYLQRKFVKNNREKQLICSIFYIQYLVLAADVLRSIMVHQFKVVRAGLNVDIAPDLIANQLNVRNGALVLKVSSLYFFSYAQLNLCIYSCFQVIL